MFIPGPSFFEKKKKKKKKKRTPDNDVTVKSKINIGRHTKIKATFLQLDRLLFYPDHVIFRANKIERKKEMKKKKE